MKINTIIKKYQNEFANLINQAATELPPMVVQLIMQDFMHQVNIQVNAAIQREATQIKAEQTAPQE